MKTKFINESLQSFIINKLLENEQSKNFVLKKGTELFHASIEDFDVKDIRGGGYDRILWTTEDSAISQTYIPQSGSQFFISSSSLTKPTQDPTLVNIQKQIGIDYDYSKVTWHNRSISSYKNAPVFEDIENKKQKLWNAYYKKRQELEEYKKEYYKKEKEDYDSITKQDYEIWGKLEDEAKELETQYQNINTDKFKNDYVNNKLKEFGYKPDNEYETNYHDYSWRLKVEDKELKPADYLAKGRLFIITPKRDMKIYDLTLGGTVEGDLTDVDYNKLQLFQELEEKGYDGIKINDYAQTKEHGNFGHRSIGFFNDSIKDLDIEVINDVTYPKNFMKNSDENDYRSDEYKKYKGIK